MTFEDLRTFLVERMRMSHVYQPLLIRALIESGGQATVRQLAGVLLSQDESQILYYEKRLKEMPVKVLKDHAVIDRDGDVIRLTTPKLDLKQRAELCRICEEKISEFIEKRGDSIWDYRSLDLSEVTDDLRYRVLKEGDSRCALCGARGKDTPLDIDHIIPRSKKGKTVYENLQVLCAKCNRTKRDRDDEDFRGRSKDDQPLEGCLFCEDGELEVIEENSLAVALEDGFPVTKGHALIVPRRHVESFTGLTAEENHAVFDLARVVSKKLQTDDQGIEGFNFGTNSGVAAGQTVMHCHYHLIPRRGGDHPEPEGGVRAVIPGKGSYR